jgi:hypothetical protein
MPIAHIAGQGVYVALVIAQTTKRNKVGPIQLPALSQALQKLAPVAKALKGTLLPPPQNPKHVCFRIGCTNSHSRATAHAPPHISTKASIHMPRMGLRGSDWYAAERSFRRYLVSHGVPTYVYATPRPLHLVG